MKGIFARHGVPQQLTTDNGPQYSSEEFAHFAQEWDFIHTTSSPFYPKGNGLAERMAQTVKTLL